MIYRYLLEIKYRTFFSFVAWVFMITVCYYFKETLLYVFIQPSLASSNSSSFYFLTTNITEIFTTYIQLSYFISNQLLIIFLIYQMFVFISTGLYSFEYHYTKGVLLWIVFFWLGLIVLLHKIIFPGSWFFFFKFQNLSMLRGLTFYFEAKLTEYLIFYKAVYFICCSVYQVAILFFVFLNLARTQLSSIKNSRKFFYFIFLIFATLITPPEVVYQLIVGIFIVIVYEFLIVFTILKTKLDNLNSVTN